MKSLLFYLFFSSLFVLGTVHSSSARSLTTDGGFEAHVHQVKTGELVCTFSLPNNYLNKDGSLAIPFEISLAKDHRAPVYTTVSQDLKISLPSTLSGTYNVQIRIGKFDFFQKVTI